MRYRKDIQIIRGVAVLLVVLFHLELPGLNSGFLGVDAFFVVSGFLMAVLYDPSDKKGFFLRRSRRLLPAYYVTVLVVLMVSVFWVRPSEFGQIVKQSTYSAFFVSNVGFWLDSSYFSKAEFTPLLHLWSLGVEIQFYLLVPILFYVFRKIRGSLFLVLLGSMVLCFTTITVSSKTSFYMMPLRLWEFLIGVGVVQLFTDKGNVKAVQLRWLGLVGLLGVILIPALHLDGSAPSWVVGHPGLHALGVCIATALVLAFGLPLMVENSKVGSYLELLGKYSYSIYLVHFPVIVLALYEPFSGTILKGGGVDTATALMLTAGCSLLMYKYVESLRRHFRLRLVAIAPIVIGFLTFVGNKYQAAVYPVEEMFIFNAWNDRSVYRCGLSNRIRDPFAISHELTREQSSQNVVMLIGDSHADSIKSTFISVAEERDIRVRFVASNRPLTLMSGGPSPKALAEDVISNNVSSVVLHFSPSGVDLAKVAEFINLVRFEGVDVSFIMPVPIWNGHVPKLLYGNLIHEDPLPRQTLEQYRNANKELQSSVHSLGIKVYEIAQYFVDPYTKFFRLKDPGGIPLYFDNGHLTLTGSSCLEPLFVSVLDNLKQ